MGQFTKFTNGLVCRHCAEPPSHEIQFWVTFFKLMARPFTAKKCWPFPPITQLLENEFLSVFNVDAIEIEKFRSRRWKVSETEMDFAA